MATTTVKAPTPKHDRETSTRRITKHNCGFLSLPNELLLTVARNLAIWDQQCLALTCKQLSNVICQDEITNIYVMRQIERGAEEFFLRLQQDWVPKNLKWCHHCGKFQSREENFWWDLLMKHKTKVGGQINSAWRYAIRKRIFMVLVLKWCDQKALQINSPIKDCPKCAISKAKMTCYGWEIRV